MMNYETSFVDRARSIFLFVSNVNKSFVDPSTRFKWRINFFLSTYFDSWALPNFDSNEYYKFRCAARSKFMSRDFWNFIKNQHWHDSTKEINI